MFRLLFLSFDDPTDGRVFLDNLFWLSDAGEKHVGKIAVFWASLDVWLLQSRWNLTSIQEFVLRANF